MSAVLKCIVCGKELEGADPNEPRICKRHWHCPVCGKGRVTHKKGPVLRTYEQCFVVEHARPYEQEEDECICKCYHCEHEWSVVAIEKIIAEKAKVTPCPCCKGTGVLNKSISEDKNA